MRTISFCAAVAAMLLSAAPATAQHITSPYRFIDARQSGELYVARYSSDTGSLELGPDGGTAFGARYTLQVGGAFAIEGDIGFLPTSRTVFAVDSLAPDTVTTPARTPVGSADLSLLTGQVGLRINVTGPRTWHGIQPYALLGAGLVVDLTGKTDVDESLPSDAVFDFGTSFAGQLGAGVELFVQRNFGVRADFRDVLWKVETPQAFLGLRTPESEWVQSPMVSLGAAVHF